MAPNYTLLFFLACVTFITYVMASSPHHHPPHHHHHHNRSRRQDSSIGKHNVPSLVNQERKINTARVNFNDSLFIDESRLTDDEDSFEASLFCESSLFSRLAVLTLEDTVLHSEWMADALAESDPERDTYWIGSKLLNNQQKWIDSSKQNSIIGEFSASLNPYLVNRTDLKKRAECLGIGRNNHNLPLFVDVSCSNLRPFICERVAKDETRGGSTHPGWIRIEDWDFKIFSSLMTHENASKHCINFDSNAHLAVIANEKIATILSHYLLTRRPSIENAWIGAKYDSNLESWVFHPSKDMIPSSKLEDTVHPEWLGSTARAGGCGLLDRHMFDHNYLLEAKCHRRKPFICSKKLGNSDNTADFPNVEGGVDVRLYLKPLSFHEAKKSCLSKKGYLAEPRSKRQIDMFISLMGENRTTVNYVWIGLEYNKEKQNWFYSSDEAAMIEPLRNYLVVNDTYIDAIEGNYTCMSLDRENHVGRILYGTDCSYRQSYYCAWKRGKMPVEKANSVGEKTTTTTTTSTTTTTTTTEQSGPLDIITENP